MRRAALLLLAAFAAADSPAIDAIVVKAEDLPEGVRAIDGIHTNTAGLKAFFETPSADVLPPELRSKLPALKGFPVPTAKRSQSFQADGGAKGTVFVFEYDTTDLGVVSVVLEPVLWGEGGPSEEHPEEIVFGGRFVWVLSFPRNDPAAEWYKDRLRRKFRIPAPRAHKDLDPLGVKIAEAMEALDFDAGLKLLGDNAKAVDGWAFGQCMIGKLSELKGEHAAAEKGYLRALALHDRLEDPLERNYVWVARDGLGRALRGQGRPDEAVTAFGRAVVAADDMGDAFAISQSGYNLAAALAAMKEYEKALRTLKGVLAIDPDLVDTMRHDPDFAEARERQEFRELLE